jgi:UDP-glucose 4-epimerase
MNFTVLGASGYIGKALAAQLVAKGHKVWLPQRQSPEIFTRPLGVVYYCIGLTGDYLEDVFKTSQAHVTYLSDLLSRAQHIEHIVYLSSVRLYDQLNADIAYESDSLVIRTDEPRYLYDLTKALGENLCLTAYAGRSSVARLSCVYDFEENSPGFLPEVIRRARHRNEILIESSPYICRDYIALCDVVSALLAIGENKNTGIFNIASGSNIYNHEIASIMKNYGIEIIYTKDQIAKTLPKCSIERLVALGIIPTSVFDALNNQLSRNKSE